MSIHIASINALHMLPTELEQHKAREGVIRQMAMHLVAGSIGNLDLTQGRDVIKYLLDTPEHYGWPAVRDHVDAAVQLAAETIVAASMGLR